METFEKQEKAFGRSSKREPLRVLKKREGHKGNHVLISQVLTSMTGGIPIPSLRATFTHTYIKHI